jgi:hypothetical protein
MSTKKPRSEYRNISENASQHEINTCQQLGELFEAKNLPTWDKLQSFPKYIRRQEISYFVANYELFKLILNVKGSIFYFGVYEGGGLMTYAHLSAAIEPYNHTRRIIGFDTFEGYPEIKAEDQTHNKKFKTLTKGGFSANALDELNQITGLYDANRALNHIPKIQNIKGDIMETLPSFMASNQQTVASMIILTVNLYHPTKLALETLYPRMPKGGVVVIHSINEEFYPGATRAFFEVLGDRSPALNTFGFTPNLAYHVKE